MSALQSLLGSQSSFVLAALAVSWIGVVLLALIAANLHFRLAHLEHERATSAEERAPFAHLLGRELAEVLGAPVAPETHLALVVSSGCASCERILTALRESPSAVPFALLWRDGTPSPPPPLPAGATTIDDGPGVAAALGVRVSPFALLADARGRIVRAAPVGRVEALAELLAEAGRDEAPSASPAPVTDSNRLSPQPLKGVSA